jgi:pimeloyl-ACP methyl ester carboxylesterase
VKGQIKGVIQKIFQFLNIYPLGCLIDMTISKFPALQFQIPKAYRHLAYSAVGDADSPHVLLCLPGLLETRATFDSLLQDAEGVSGLRVVGMDLCGRGDSSPLAGDTGYTMQVYLEDIEHFIRAELMPDGKPVPRIEVLGTSMGGILAMYLAHDASNHISGLTLNDIGLDLPWMSIYGLYDGMKKAGRLPTPEEMADKLNVSIGVALAVQSPTHFDLSYRKDWKGMKFGHLLSDFKGSLRLVHGSDSGVCTAKEVKDLLREFPKAKVLEVAGAAHPVPFNAAVNKFVLKSLGLPAATADKALPTTDLTQMDMALDPVPVWQETVVATDAPVAVLQSVEVMPDKPLAVEVPVQAPLTLPVEPPVKAAQPTQGTPLGLWAWLKQQLRGTTKK